MADMWGQLGFFAKGSIAMAVAPCIVAIVYALRPTERKLAFMRPLSLAAIFAALSTLMMGGSIVLQGVAATPRESLQMAPVYMGLAETLVVPFITFGFLTVSWLLVAAGMLRRIP